MKRSVENLYLLQTLETQSRKTDAVQIHTLRQGIPAHLLVHYDRLRTRGKKGVAVVRNGVCTGCHLRVATGVHNALLLGQGAIACGNCGSYLYLPPKQEPAPAPKPRRVAATA